MLTSKMYNRYDKESIVFADQFIVNEAYYFNACLSLIALDILVLVAVTRLNLYGASLFLGLSVLTVITAYLSYFSYKLGFSLKNSKRITVYNQDIKIDTQHPVYKKKIESKGSNTWEQFLTIDFKQDATIERYSISEIGSDKVRMSNKPKIFG